MSRRYLAANNLLPVIFRGRDLLSEFDGREEEVGDDGDEIDFIVGKVLDGSGIEIDNTVHVLPVGDGEGKHGVVFFFVQFGEMFVARVMGSPVQ